MKQCLQLRAKCMPESRCSNVSLTLLPNCGQAQRLLSVFIIVVALCNKADHYIFALWFLSSIFFLFFPRLISAATYFLPYFYTWCGPSANLECRSWLAANTGSKKNRHLGTIAQLRRAISSQLRHVSTIGKKTC